MYVIPEKKFCFLAHPRTASVTTRDILVEKCGAELVGDHHSVLATPKPRDWTVAVTVRHPLDVLVSWWHKNQSNRNWTLAEFIPRWYHTTKYLRHTRMFYHTHFATHILRYERLEDDLSHMLVGFGLAPVELPPKSEAGLRGTRPFMEFYEDEPRAYDLAVGFFKKEMLQYGYQ